MKIRFGISLLLFVISALVLYNHYGQIAVTAIKHKTVIVIDVGHGGSDPGKVSVDGIKEKDVNNNDLILYYCTTGGYRCDWCDCSSWYVRRCYHRSIRRHLRMCTDSVRDR